MQLVNVKHGDRWKLVRISGTQTSAIARVAAFHLVHGEYQSDEIMFRQTVPVDELCSAGQHLQGEQLQSLEQRYRKAS